MIPLNDPPRSRGVGFSTLITIKISSIYRKTWRYLEIDALLYIFLNHVTLSAPTSTRATLSHVGLPSLMTTAHTS